MNLQKKFNPKLNALNAVRLVMATGVIFWHAFPISGTDIYFSPARQFLAEVWVDGFFAISGFLITASWMRRPNVRSYVVARLVRILPAFYVCLILIAFLIAPIGVALQGGNGFTVLASVAPYDYVFSNSAVWIFERSVGDTPVGVPYPGTWNGSLWTLGWELLCYVGVLVLGLAGLLKRRVVIPCAFLGSTALLVVVEVMGIESHASNAARFSVMFLAGAIIFQYQNRIPCSWRLVIFAFGVTVVTMTLPDYRVLGSLFWAYTVISIGALLQYRKLVLRNDISYGVYIYAFPIQQLTVIGLGSITPMLFGVIATVLTLPAAAASWFLIEKPAMKLRHWLDPSPRVSGSMALAHGDESLVPDPTRSDVGRPSTFLSTGGTGQ